MILPQSWSCRIAGIGRKPVLNLQISIRMLLSVLLQKRNGTCPHCNERITIEGGFRIHTTLGKDYKERYADGERLQRKRKGGGHIKFTKNTLQKSA